MIAGRDLAERIVEQPAPLQALHQPEGDQGLAGTAVGPAASTEGRTFLAAPPLSSRVISAISASSCLFLFSSDSSANSNIL